MTVRDAPGALDERGQAAVETIRALSVPGIDDPFEGLRDNLRARNTTGEHEPRELLLLAETLTALAAEAEALAFLQR
jgi:hypothetical protein